MGAERGLDASHEDHVVGKDSVAKPLETKELSSPRNNFSAGLSTSGLASTYILISYFCRPEELLEMLLTLDIPV